MEYPIFEKKYPVHVYETGPDGRLNLHSLFDYFQDIAAEHAVQLGFGREDLMKHNSFWVLSRIYACIYDLPGWDESIILTTWPRGTDALFALRDFEARNTSGKPVAHATSSWLLVDRDSKRIQRPVSSLSMLDLVTGIARVLPRNAMKIKAGSERQRLSREFNVTVSDLDINLHTNNTNYLRWVVDTYPLDFIMNNIPDSVEINYLAESRFGDPVTISESQDNINKNIFTHSAVRTSDDAELCRIRIEWKSNHLNQ